jgi:hypothetical protein
MQIQVINFINLSAPSQPIRALEMMQQQFKVTNLINLPSPSQPTRVLENVHQPHQPSTTKSTNQSSMSSMHQFVSNIIIEEKSVRERQNEKNQSKESANSGR